MVIGYEWTTLRSHDFNNPTPKQHLRCIIHTLLYIGQSTSCTVRVRTVCNSCGRDDVLTASVVLFKQPPFKTGYLLCLVDRNVKISQASLNHRAFFFQPINPKTHSKNPLIWRLGNWFEGSFLQHSVWIFRNKLRPRYQGKRNSYILWMYLVTYVAWMKVLCLCDPILPKMTFSALYTPWLQFFLLFLL